MTKTIMIQGTGSSVGKSLITAGLCRIFLQDGYKACPFKAQNMALNSFVTKDGREMGRAQVVQAQAAGIEPHVDMNPILIKPTGDSKAQIIIQGKPIGNMSAAGYHKYKRKALSRVLNSFNRLKTQYEVMVIEGAGSPAEINLKEDDIVNMRIASLTDSPVILIGDIDKGGVFASLVGTLELLNEEERERIKGFIINKFRGDKRLLRKGLRFLEERTGKPVLGVIPYLKDIALPEEDSVALENRGTGWGERVAGNGKINIAVIKLPFISNFTDFDALENEPDVKLEYVSDKDVLVGADVIIIPGTKNTVKDLLWLRKTGIADEILYAIRYTLYASLIGICGGYQMLGEVIYDNNGIESAQKEIKGLGLLPVSTTFESEKILSQREAVEIATGIKLNGYEIHHGRTVTLGQLRPMLKIVKDSRIDGVESDAGNVWGTYLHGIFDNDIFRRQFLNRIRAKKGLRLSSARATSFNINARLDNLAGLVRQNINMKLLHMILNRHYHTKVINYNISKQTIGVPCGYPTTLHI